jgi:hypothetical protein
VIRQVNPNPPRRKKADAQTRFYRVLDKGPPASLEEIARRAKVGKPTAKKWRDAWLEEHQVTEAIR